MTLPIQLPKRKPARWGWQVLRCLSRTRVYRIHERTERIFVPSQQITYKSITYAGQATPKLCREGDTTLLASRGHAHLRGGDIKQLRT